MNTAPGPPRLVGFEVSGPYDLALSLRAAASFASSHARAAAKPDARLAEEPAAETAAEPAASLRSAVRIDSVPSLLEVRQSSFDPPRLEATARPKARGETVEAIARRLVNASLDLQPFYESARDHPLLGPLTVSLRGMKAFRPATLFEMLVTAVIEQQISLLAAHHIRGRLVESFGQPLDGFVVFPSPEALAEAPLEALRGCGLSQRKAEYIGGLAQLVTTGREDLEALEGLPDDEVRARVAAIRGFGRWSADYLLIRGLGRPDVVPVDDLGIQTLLGRLMGEGARLTPDGVRRVLEPLAPFRGVAVFYLLAATRLSLVPTARDRKGYTSANN